MLRRVHSSNASTLFSNHGLLSKQRLFSAGIPQKKDLSSYDIFFDPLLNEKSKIVMPISFARYKRKAKDSPAQLAQRRAEYDATLSMLFKRTAQLIDTKAIQSVDVIATTALHRNWSSEEIEEINSHFYKTHGELLKKQTACYNWDEWVDQVGRKQLEINYEEILSLTGEDTNWYTLMLDLHKNLQTEDSSSSLQVSLQYQREECAAIRLMNGYTNMVYLGQLHPVFGRLYKTFPNEHLPLFTSAGMRKKSLFYGAAEMPISEGPEGGGPTRSIMFLLKDTLFSPHCSPQTKKDLYRRIQATLDAYESTISAPNPDDKSNHRLGTGS